MQQLAQEKRYCPVCETTASAFEPFGVIPRADAQCRACGALERHRLVWLFFKRRTNIFDGQRRDFLHVAPEPCFEVRLRNLLPNGYLTADLQEERAMVRLDVTDIQFSAETFDAVYCSHVLEHVEDDRRALGEFYRILKPGGWAILTVPIVGEKTFEDATITDPLERLRLFGETDHVRVYGSDYIERLREAGFEVGVIMPSDFLDDEEITRMGINAAAGEIFYCTKR